MVSLKILLLLILLIVLFIIYSAYFRKNNVISLEQAKKMNETDISKYFRFREQKFHYTEEGKGQTVVLIHGLGDSFRNFIPFSSKLAKNYHVLCLDLPAFGLSEVPKQKYEGEALLELYRSYLSAFIREKNIDNFHLVGNSLGGLVSWDWAGNVPFSGLKSLTLIASAGFQMARVKKNITLGIMEHIPKFVLKRGAPMFISKLAAETCIPDKGKIPKEFIAAHHSMINKEGVIEHFYDLMDNNIEPNTEMLKEIQRPTLIVWGTKDKIVPFSHVRMFSDKLPNSKELVYENGGHYPQLEFANEFLKDWQNFADQI